MPFFTTEFNRCVAHDFLNRLVNSHLNEPEKNSWYQIGPACRTNDMRKVDSGWHATVFEIMAWVAVCTPENQANTRTRLVADVLEFLVNHVGLTRDRLAFTIFGGGRFIGNVELPPDEDWRNAWRLEEIDERAIYPVPGPKNFLLFVGGKERCGPKCEVLYRHEDRWLEIGTLILDNARLVRDYSETWRIEPSETVVAGAAFGLERLMIAQKGSGDLATTESFRPLFDVVEKDICGQTAQLLRGDIRVLVDQAKAASFILCEPRISPGTPQHALLRAMVRRIRRKLAVLSVTDWPNLIERLECAIVEIYGERYPNLSLLKGKLVVEVQQIPWPEGWNPESYQPLANDN